MERVGLHHVQLGLDFVALRFGSPYGPGKLITYGDKRHVFDRATINGQILENAMKGEPTRIPKGGDGKRCAVYVKDVVQGVIKACFTKNPQSRIYNISVGEGYSFKDWAKVVKELFPRASVEIGPGPLSELNIGDGVLDISKARRELSYEPQYSLRKGIEDYVEEMDRLKLSL
jgi:nucleoside-diphosphate-sugar epimerase